MRVAIIGNSGSGKTTLARLLAARGHLPVLDLDSVAWVPGEIAVAREADAAAHDVRVFCTQHTDWVVEGCYANLVQEACAFAPRLIFLDPGLEQCLANCRARAWEPHKYASAAEQNARLEFLLRWVAEYYERDGDMSHREHRALYEAYTGPKQWVASSSDTVLLHVGE